MKSITWNPPSQLPTKAGVYKCAGSGGECELPFPYYYFNGEKWFNGADDDPEAIKNQALALPERVAEGEFDFSWREIDDD